jgi:hypothetical protein
LHNDEKREEIFVIRRNVGYVGRASITCRARGKKAGITYPDYDSVEQFTWGCPTFYSDEVGSFVFVFCSLNINCSLALFLYSLRLLSDEIRPDEHKMMLTEPPQNPLKNREN